MGRRGSAVMKGIIGAGRFPFRDAACGRRAGVPSLRSLCHYSFAPLELNQFPPVTHGLRRGLYLAPLRGYFEVGSILWRPSTPLRAGLRGYFELGSILWCHSTPLRAGFAAISSWAHLAPPFDSAQGRLSRLFRAGLILRRPSTSLKAGFRGYFEVGSILWCPSTPLGAGFRGYFEAHISLSNSRSSWRYRLLGDSHRFNFSSRHCRAGLSHIAAARLRRGTVLSSENIYNIFIISMLANRGLGNPAILLDKQPLKFLQLALNGFKC